MNDVILEQHNVLRLNTLRCPEVIELQRILGITKDGYFGKNTEKELYTKLNKSDITLFELKILGYDVRKTMPVSEIWWMEFK